MSIHRSLKSKGKLKRHRSVLTRTERLDTLKNEERWQAGDSVYGLPKVRVIRAKRKKAAKEVEKLPEGTAIAEGAAAEETASEGAAQKTGESKS